MRLQASSGWLEAYSRSCRDGATSPALERLRAKWIPVRVKKTRQNKNLEPRSDSIGTGKALECVLVVGRPHGSLPGAMEFFQHLLSRGAPAVDNALQRLEMAGFVTTRLIEPAAPPQARIGHRQAFPGDFEQIAVPYSGLE